MIPRRTQLPPVLPVHAERLAPNRARRSIRRQRTALRMTQTPPQGQNYTRARVRRERMGGVSTFGATSH
jgi:hypothetical protein